MSKQSLNQNVFSALDVGGFARVFGMRSTPLDSSVMVIVEARSKEGGPIIALAEMHGSHGAVARHDESTNVRFRVLKSAPGTSVAVTCESHGD